jgi:hypothetical protein
VRTHFSKCLLLKHLLLLLLLGYLCISAGTSAAKPHHTLLLLLLLGATAAVCSHIACTDSAFGCSTVTNSVTNVSGHHTPQRLKPCRTLRVQNLEADRTLTAAI